jgi:hypothetical protein
LAIGVMVTFAFCAGAAAASAVPAVLPANAMTAAAAKSCRVRICVPFESLDEDVL